MTNKPTPEQIDAAVTFINTPHVYAGNRKASVGMTQTILAALEAIKEREAVDVGKVKDEILTVLDDTWDVDLTDDDIAEAIVDHLAANYTITKKD